MSETSDFWSRRKAAVEAEKAEEVMRREAQAGEAEQAELAGVPEAEVLRELGLPEPESMKPGDDFTAFMAKAVPEAIRRRALRVLWKSNPVLANVDMLVDYGEDFTDAAMAVENIQTAYQVGKGMLKHIEEMARQAAEAEAEAEAGPEDELQIEAAPEEEPVLVAAEEHEPLPEEPVEDLADVGLTPQPRRMTFRIEETA